MLNRLRPFALSAVTALSACADPASSDDAAAPADPAPALATGKADGTASGALFVSASTVEALEGDVTDVKPPAETTTGFLAPMSCLGHYGPLGPWGALGITGPLGDNAWNPALYISGGAALPWYDLAETFTSLNGPLSADGPLGSVGPLGATAAADGDFAGHLKAGGLFGVLGPVGPLGALGPLGPLGPVGAHGFRRDSNGRYLRNTAVVRTVDVPWTAGGEVRRYGLVEMYEERFVKTFTENDTSFVVKGLISPSSETDRYPFISGEDQVVTVLVVPESASMFTPQAMTVLYAAALIGFQYPAIAPTPRYTTDDFDLRLEDATGKRLAVSDSVDYADWIQVQVPANTKLRVAVNMATSWDPWNVSPISRRYRLYVVGSTKHHAASDVRGPHRLVVGP